MTEPAIKTATPLSDGGFFDGLEDLIRWRRDVRRYRPDPVDGRLIDELIGLAALAPSVGNSQPWRFVTAADPARRERVIENFDWRQLVTDRRSFDRVEQFVWHQVVLVRLLSGLRAEFGRWLLLVDAR